MELIDDLGTELAMDFLVERRHRQKIDSENIPILIRRINAALQSVSHRQNSRFDVPTADQNASTFSH